MIQIRNHTVIRKLSHKSLKKNKMRNVFTVLGIILTSLLISAACSSALSLKKTNDYYVQMMNNGSEIQLTGDVSLEKELARVEDIDTVAIWGESSPEILQNPELVGRNFTLMYSNRASYELNEIQLIKGDYPVQRGEILLSDTLVDALDSKPKVGEEVTLYVAVLNPNNQYEVIPLSFKVSGIYKPIWHEGSAPIPAFVDTNFMEKYNTNLLQKTLFMLTHEQLTTQSSYQKVEQIAREIADEIGLTDEVISPGAYFFHKANKAQEVPIILAVLLGISMVMFIGYLLISNILYISIVQDIKYYGLLKTIGTTSKQIKKMIIHQGNVLCLIGIPIGIVLGYMISILLLPQALKSTAVGPYVQIEKSPFGFLFAIAFSYITVYISCMKPCKVACRISPIEAVKYVGIEGQQAKISTKKASKGNRLATMAYYNLLKNKKKLVMTSLSMGIGLAIFCIVFTLSNSIDPILRADNQMFYEFEIHHAEELSSGMKQIKTAKGYEFLAGKEYQAKERFQPIPLEMYSEIEALDHVESVNKYYKARTSEMGFVGQIKNEGMIGQEVDSYIQAGFPYSEVYYHEKGDLKLEIIGIEEQALREATQMDARLDTSSWDFGKFSRGESILFIRGINGVYTFNDATFYGGDIIKKGNPISIDFYREQSGDYVTKTFEVLDVATNTFETWDEDVYRDFTFEPFILSAQTFEEIYPNYEECIYKMGVKINGNLQETIDKIMEIVRRYGNFQVSTTNKQDIIDAVEVEKATVELIGMSIAFVVAFIGFLNIVNTVFTNILSRRKEFAILESIGMTKKQIKKSLIFEGLYYSFFACLVMTPISIVGSLIMSELQFCDRLSVGHLVGALILSSLVMSMSAVGISLLAYRYFCTGNLVEMIKEEN